MEFKKTDRLGATAAERRLLQAVAAGEIVDFRVNRPAGNDPEQGSAWGPERTVRAAAIRAIAAETDTEFKVNAGGLKIAGAKIAGALDLEGAQIRCPLYFIGCFFEEPITLRDASAHTIFFHGSRVAAISAEGLRLRGSLFMRDGFHTTGVVDLTNAHIDGFVQCHGGLFENPEGITINGYGLTVDGHLNLRGGFHSKGMLSLLNARIRGQIILDGARLENPGRITLEGYELHAESSMFMRQGFYSTGMINLRSAHIGGDLEFQGGLFENPGRAAIDADGVRVAGILAMREGFRSVGEVRIRGASVGGVFECQGGRFDNPRGIALSAQGLDVHGHLRMADGFEASGKVDISNSQVGSSIDCAGGKFDDSIGSALDANDVVVNGSIILMAGFKATGLVSIRGAKITGGVYCRGGTFRNPRSTALSLQATTAKALMMDSMSIEGAIDLTSAAVDDLIDDAESWPAPGNLMLDGFVYRRLTAGSPTSASARRQWLESATEFRPQPYEQLARVLHEMGYEDDARRIGMAKQVTLRRSGRLGRAGWLWNLFLGATIGYGYRPWRALLWLVAVVALGIVLFSSALSSGLMVPTNRDAYTLYERSNRTELTAGYPHFNALLYSLDLLVPGIELGQKSCWFLKERRPHDVGFGICYALALVYYIACLTLVGAVIAAMAGLVKKD